MLSEGDIPVSWSVSCAGTQPSWQSHSWGRGQRECPCHDASDTPAAPPDTRGEQEKEEKERERWQLVIGCTAWCLPAVLQILTALMDHQNPHVALHSRYQACTSGCHGNYMFQSSGCQGNMRSVLEVLLDMYTAVIHSWFACLVYAVHNSYREAGIGQQLQCIGPNTLKWHDVTRDYYSLLEITGDYWRLLGDY